MTAYSSLLMQTDGDKWVSALHNANDFIKNKY